MINNYEELRSAVVELYSQTLTLANAKTKEEATAAFARAKDLLIDTFKYKAGELNEQKK